MTLPPIEEPPTDPVARMREHRAAEGVGVVVALVCFLAFLWTLLGPPSVAMEVNRWRFALVVLVAGFGVGMYFVFPKRTTGLVTFAASVPQMVRLGRREADAVVIRPTIDGPQVPDPDCPEPEEIPPAPSGPPPNIPP